MIRPVAEWIVWLWLLPLRLVLRGTQVILGKEGEGRRKKMESYAHMDHLALNAERPRTSWLNMGDWEHTAHFPTACENLAVRLYEASELKEGASILDVGHGSGDSLALLQRRYRPRSLQGVTSMPLHARLARQRIDEEAGETKTKIDCDDAVAFVRRLSALEATRPRFDRIFALDCAYHFDTRQRFLTASRRLLADAGRLALVDLVAAYPYPRSSKDKDLYSFTASPSLPAPASSPSLLTYLRHHLTLRMAGVPAQNIVDVSTYASQLRQAGYTGDVRIVDISHVVFPGFSEFLSGLGTGEERAWRGGGPLQLWGLRQFGDVVKRWSQGGDGSTIRCVLVVACAS